LEFKKLAADDPSIVSRSEQLYLSFIDHGSHSLLNIPGSIYNVVRKYETSISSEFTSHRFLIGFE